MKKLLSLLVLLSVAIPLALNAGKGKKPEKNTHKKRIQTSNNRNRLVEATPPRPTGAMILNIITENINNENENRQNVYNSRGIYRNFNEEGIKNRQAPRGPLRLVNGIDEDLERAKEDYQNGVNREHNKDRILKILRAKGEPVPTEIESMFSPKKRAVPLSKSSCKQLDFEKKDYSDSDDEDFDDNNGNNQSNMMEIEA